MWFVFLIWLVEITQMMILEMKDHLEMTGLVDWLSKDESFNYI